MGEAGGRCQPTGSGEPWPSLSRKVVQPEGRVSATTPRGGLQPSRPSKGRPLCADHVAFHRSSLWD